MCFCHFDPISWDFNAVYIYVYPLIKEAIFCCFYNWPFFSVNIRTIYGKEKISPFTYLTSTIRHDTQIFCGVLNFLYNSLFLRRIIKRCWNMRRIFIVYLHHLPYCSVFYFSNLERATIAFSFLSKKWMKMVLKNSFYFSKFTSVLQEEKIIW